MRGCGDAERPRDASALRGRSAKWLDRETSLANRCAQVRSVQLSEEPRAVEVYLEPCQSLDEGQILGLHDQSLIGGLYTSAAGSIAVWVDLSDLLTEESEASALSSRASGDSE